MRYLVLLGALILAGCSGSDTAPSDPTITVTSTTGYFGTTLAVQGTAFSGPFTVSLAGPLSVTLTSVTIGSNVTNPPSPVVLALSVGVASADGSTCTVSSTINTAPGLTAQLTTQAPAGLTCVQVADPGTLTQPVNFLVRVVHT